LKGKLEIHDVGIQKKRGWGRMAACHPSTKRSEGRRRRGTGEIVPDRGRI